MMTCAAGRRCRGAARPARPGARERRAGPTRAGLLTAGPPRPARQPPRPQPDARARVRARRRMWECGRLEGDEPPPSHVSLAQGRSCPNPARWSKQPRGAAAGFAGRMSLTRPGSQVPVGRGPGRPRARGGPRAVLASPCLLALPPITSNSDVMRGPRQDVMSGPGPVKVGRPGPDVIGGPGPDWGADAGRLDLGGSRAGRDGGRRIW